MYYLLFFFLQNPQQRLNVGEILDHPFLKSGPSVPNSMTLKLKALEVDSDFSGPHVFNAKGVKVKQGINRDMRESSECLSNDNSTVHLNDSRSHGISTNSMSRVPRIPLASPRGNVLVSQIDPTPCSSSSRDSSPASSFSSPSKSIGTSSSTLVSEYHASLVGFHSKIEVAGTCRSRNRDGTNPGDDRHTEESSGVSMSTINQPSNTMGAAVKCAVESRYGSCLESGHTAPSGSNTCHREVLRRPIMSAEPEMSPSPSSSAAFRSRGSPTTLPLHSAPTNLSRSFLPMRTSSTHVHDLTRTVPMRTSSSGSESTHSSWLLAIRSVRESMSELLPYDTGGAVGKPECTALSCDAADRMGDHREERGFTRIDISMNKNREGHDRFLYPPHAASNTSSVCPARHNGSEKSTPFRVKTMTSNLHGDGNSLSTSVSTIDNSSFIGANWFGELGSSSSSSRCAPLDPFLFLSPQKEVLVLNENGTAIYCGIIKDKSGRMIPCRLFSSSLTPNIVTLGKLDEAMLRELRGLQTHPMSETDSESDSDTDIDDDEFIRKHNSALSDIDYSGQKSVALVHNNTPRVEASSQYSEFDSFYNCDSDEEVVKKDSTVTPRATPDLKKKAPMREKEHRSDTRLSAASGLRLLSEELLLRSYHLDATPLIRSSLQASSTSRIRSSCDSRLSNIQPLPTVLIALYNRAAEVFENIRRRVPKIIMYVPAAVQPPLTDPVRGNRIASHYFALTHTLLLTVANHLPLLIISIPFSVASLYYLYRCCPEMLFDEQRTAP